MIAVVAVGGNALLEAGAGSDEEQYRAVRQAVKEVASLLEQGWRVVLTHGNGPQVGALLRRSELARDFIPTMGLDSCVAATQATIGYQFQRALNEEFKLRGLARTALTVVTQVLVAQDDPGFERPTKPIGPFLSQEQAEERRRDDGWRVVEDSGRGWRRVVASPKPTSIVELAAIRALVEAGYVVVAGGGGGIPVSCNGDGLRGRAAVIDKDRTSGLLARELEADLLVLVTAVERVCLNFRKPDERQLDRVTAAEAQGYQQQGQFPAGSMGPKVEAVLSFLQGGGKRAVITNLESLCRAARGEAGTEFVP